jgi:hypothetical protein
MFADLLSEGKNKSITEIFIASTPFRLSVMLLQLIKNSLLNSLIVLDRIYVRTNFGVVTKIS